MACGFLIDWVGGGGGGRAKSFHLIVFFRFGMIFFNRNHSIFCFKAIWNDFFQNCHSIFKNMKIWNDSCI